MRFLDQTEQDQEYRNRRNRERRIRWWRRTGSGSLMPPRKWKEERDRRAVD
jgi:hypothetical protein